MDNNNKNKKIIIFPKILLKNLKLRKKLEEILKFNNNIKIIMKMIYKNKVV